VPESIKMKSIMHCISSSATAQWTGIHIP